MESVVYNKEGVAKGKTVLPESIFGLPWNSDLVHQVVVSMESSARSSTANAKTRGEVRGGGKKPWQQKGTGQARHGSTRSPIWVGGGVTHGPRKEKNYERKVNRKMKTKALYTILSRKFRDGEVVFIDSLDLKDGKTKSAAVVLNDFKKIPNFKMIAGKKQNALSIFFPVKHTETFRGFGNISNVSLEEIRTMNPVSILKYKGIVIVNPEESLKVLSGKLETKIQSVDSSEKKKVAVKRIAKLKNSKQKIVAKK
jgi:large subunit ribosomal protein L4